MTDAQKALDAKMHADNDAGAGTVREYLQSLLVKLWHEGEGFSGKRPFGNSGWHYALYDAVHAAGLVDSNKHGEADAPQCEALIKAAIIEAFNTTKGE